MESRKISSNPAEVAEMSIKYKTTLKRKNDLSEREDQLDCAWLGKQLCHLEVRSWRGRSEYLEMRLNLRPREQTGERELFSPLSWWLYVSSCLPASPPPPGSLLVAASDCVQPTVLSAQGRVGDGRSVWLCSLKVCESLVCMSSGEDGVWV